MPRVIKFFTGLISLSLCQFYLASCSSKAFRPCSEGGGPARDKISRGTKQCAQIKDRTGQFMNHGPYVEWHPNGMKAAEGEFKMGHKQGRWLEWDEKGKKISDRFFENGHELTPPNKVQ